MVQNEILIQSVDLRRMPVGCFEVPLVPLVPNQVQSNLLISSTTLGVMGAPANASSSQAALMMATTSQQVPVYERFSVEDLDPSSLLLCVPRAP